MIARTIAAHFCLIAGLVAAGCQSSTDREEPVRPVTAMKVGDVKAISARSFPGRARARNVVDLSFQVSGPLLSLPVDVGSEVKKGDVVAAIDPRDFQAALDSAQGNLERARANLLAMERGARPEELEQLEAAVAEADAKHRQAIAEHGRNEQMLPKGAISRSEFDISMARRDTTAAQVKTAQENLKIGRTGARTEDLEAKRSEIRALEAAVASAQNHLDYAVLRAPFDGRVAARYVENFQTVQAKQPIVRLLDVSTIEVTVQVPETLISLVPQVRSVVCRFDAFDGRDFEGHVSEIGSEASETTRTYPVTVQVEQPEDVQILPGMAATVSNRMDSHHSNNQDLIVPVGAVFTDEAGQQSYVWIVNESTSKVSRRKVSTGKLTPVGITVTEGLEQGEWVVCAGVNSLREDQQVRILQEAGR